MFYAIINWLDVCHRLFPQVNYLALIEPMSVNCEKLDILYK